MKKLFILLLIILCLPIYSSASHIIGGELTYRCLGSNNYEISLKLYRDCFYGCCDLPDPENVNITYSNGTAITGSPFAFKRLTYDSLDLTYGNICFTPPNDICVQQATYKDTINLPPAIGGYQIYWQRCCRNGSIKNIVSPLGTRGALYAIIPMDTKSDTASKSSNFDGKTGAGTFTNWLPLTNNLDFSDNVYDTLLASNMANGANTNYIYSTNHGFAIPSGAVIKGIEIFIEKSALVQSGGTVNDNRVRIIKSGTVQGAASEHANSAIWAAKDSVWKYGGPTDLWGTTWTATNINATNFGVALSAKKVSGPNDTVVFRLDHVRIKVYFDYAKDKCNSAPVFNNLPPVFICFGDSLVFDNSADDTTKDNDGDSITYALCTPWEETPATLADPVDWKAPYTQTNQIDGILTVNSVSGQLIVAPTDSGQYLMGVCAYEYRNDTLLNVNRRDFQFNVVNCVPIVSASIPKPDLPCGGKTVSFKNDSAGAITYDWNFGVIPITTDTSTKAAPTYTYPDTGTYTVQLIVNKGMSCVDTGSTTFNLRRMVDAKFGAKGFCLGSPTTFTDSSKSDSGNVTSWSWTFPSATPSSSTLKNPTVTFSSGGTFNVTLIATSDSGCTDTIIKPITISNITIVTNGTDVSCNGGSNGVVTATGKNGASPYGYKWSNNATTQTISGLTAGIYTVTVTDNNGCKYTKSDTIGEPTVLSIVKSSTNVSCFGGNNGTINLTVTGGTPPYTFKWVNGATTEDLTGLTAGTYTATLTDAKNCKKTVSQIITEPATTVSNSLTSSNVSCFSGSNGSINNTPSGGTPGYTYKWINGATTEDVSSLTAGTYTVTTTDANGCKDIDAITITQPTAALTNSFTQTNVSCFGSSNATINLTVLGGTSMYAYKWANGATTEDISSLIAGTYTVTTTDANGCKDIDAVSITQPAAALSNSFTQTNVSCFGGSNATINLTVSGGTSTYAYKWTNGATTEDISSLTAGTYTVTTTDANGCKDIDAVTITQPAAALTNSFTQTNVSCFGVNNGSINLTVSGGTSTYAYKWTNGATTEDISSLAAGIYTVTTTDAKGCKDIDVVTITQPATVLSVSLSKTDALCNGASTGTASSTPAGGTSPYSFKWATGATTQNISSIPAANYTVTVTDANGCRTQTAITVNQPAALVIYTLSLINATCGIANGSVRVSAKGGTSGYIYKWNNGDTDSNATSLAAGIYVVTVTDANGCKINASRTITNISGPSVYITKSVDVSCNGGNNGSATGSHSGGDDPVIYLWTPGGQTTKTVTGLVAGIYTFEATDDNGCKAPVQVTINQPSALVISKNNSNVSCNSGSNGTATVTGKGGTPGYTYKWSNGATTQSLTGLSASTVSATVTDSKNCKIITSIIITAPSALSIIKDSTNTTCNGISDGTATVTVSGGTPVYRYKWSHGPTSQFVSGLAAGNYTVTIKDANNCVVTAKFNIQEPTILFTTSVSITDVPCFGGANGAIDITVSGGVPPYNYKWSNKATTEDINSLSSGTYTVTVYDFNVCDVIDNISVKQPAAALATTLDSTNATCNGLSNGTVNLTVSAGTLPYTYKWSNGATTEDLVSANAGTYTVTITDANKCKLTDIVTINQPTATVVNAGSNDTVCANNATVTLSGSVSGGTTTTGKWLTTGSGAFTPNDSMMAPTYTPSVADTAANSVILMLTSTNNKGCPSISDSLTLLILPAPVVNAGIDDSVCRSNPDYVLAGTLLHATGGFWTSSGTGIFNPNNTNLNATYEPTNADTLAGKVKISLTATGINLLCKNVTDTMLLVFTPDKIKVNAGPDDTICANQTSIQLQGSLAVATGGQWTTLGSGTFTPSNTTLNGFYNPSPADTLAGSVKIVLTTTGNGGCIGKTDTMSLKIQKSIIVKAGINDTVCANDDSVAVTGIVSNATGGIWLTLGSGSFTNTTSLSTFYKFSAADTTAKSVKLVLSSTGNGSCIPTTDTVQIFFVPGPSARFDFKEICEGDTVFFYDSSSSTGSVTAWHWDFNNSGDTSNLQNPYYIYSSFGTYNVSLAIKSNTGCWDTLVKPVVVHDYPNASFSNTAECFIDTARFFDKSTIGNDIINSWNWNFGDATGSFKQNPVHYYVSDGNYTIQLIVTSTFGCKDTSAISIEVSPGPVVNFSYTSACLKNVTSFTDFSTIKLGYNIIKWSWDFDDGNKDTLQNPSHLYAKDTLYNVTLVVTSDSGCTDTITRSVEVNALPIANFGPVNVCLSDTAPFLDSSKIKTGHSIIKWYWDYGDGNSDTLKKVVHKYDTAGTYNITLTVTSQAGCKDTVVKSVVVYPAPFTKFNVNNVCLNSTTQFTDNSLSAVSWYWDFGDGDTAMTKNPIHVFAKDTLFLVQLIAENIFGCQDTFRKQITIQSLPTTDFNEDARCFVDSVHFTNLSTVISPYKINSLYWDLGDGTSDTSQNPVHSYNNPDTNYLVTLIAVTDLGCADTISRTIRVLPGPLAEYTYEKICIPDTTQFTDLSVIQPGYSIVSWYWDFGAGGTTTVQNPIQLFTSDEVYNVTLVVTSDSGCVDSVSKSIFVSNKPNASLMFNEVCLSDTSTFIDNSKVNNDVIIKWLWDFGDGNTDTVKNAKHLYSNEGNYVISLIAMTKSGCADTVSNPFTVYPDPVADFTTTAECYSDSAFFFDNSTISFGSIGIWTWQFGDGMSSNDSSPAHLYANPGTYAITLKTISDFGCQDSLSKTLDIQPAPLANFGYSEICLNETTNFVDSSTISTGNISSWNWYFNDGKTDTVKNTSNLYALDGFYNVILVVTSDKNCTDTILKTIEIHPLPEPDFVSSENCENRLIEFTDTSNIKRDSIIDWYWDMGNGLLYGNQNVNTVYNSAGAYTVKLILTSDFGCKDSIEKNIIIEPNPIADFNEADTCLNIAASFNDKSTITNGSITGWQWFFSDGDSSSSQNTNHKFNNPGIFNTILIVQSDKGCIDTVIKTTEVYPVPDAFFTNKEACKNEIVLFKDSSAISSGNLINWTFYFNNGDTVKGPNASYLFPNNGLQNIMYVVTSEFGCKDTFESAMNIYRPPIAIINGYGDCTNEGTVFTDESIETDGLIISWYWYFGDGTSDTLTETKHVYDSAGQYVVNLVVESDLGCIDTALVNLTINPSPFADFTVSEDIIYPEKIIQFFDQSLGNPNQWYWHFDDSTDVDANPETTSSEVNPEHWWFYPGIKNVLMVVTNQFGCMDSILKQLIIKLDPGINTVIVPGQSNLNNQFLNVRGGNYIAFDLKVFNEWGELIFQTANPLQGWDGTYKGKIVPNGVYVYQYHVVRDDHQAFDGHGNVTVIR